MSWVLVSSLILCVISFLPAFFDHGERKRAFYAAASKKEKWESGLKWIAVNWGLPALAIVVTIGQAIESSSLEDKITKQTVTINTHSNQLVSAQAEILDLNKKTDPRKMIDQQTAIAPITSVAAHLRLDVITDEPDSWFSSKIGVVPHLESIRVEEIIEGEINRDPISFYLSSGLVQVPSGGMSSSPTGSISSRKRFEIKFSNNDLAGWDKQLSDLPANEAINRINTIFSKFRFPTTNSADLVGGSITVKMNDRFFRDFLIETGRINEGFIVLRNSTATNFPARTVIPR